MEGLNETVRRRGHRMLMQLELRYWDSEMCRGVAYSVFSALAEGQYHGRYDRAERQKFQ